MSAPVLDRPPRHLATLMNVGAAIALLAAVVGTLTDVAAFGGIAVGVIVAAPLLRVAQLGAHWLRIGDRRFALAAVGLLLVTAAGAALALL